MSERETILLLLKRAHARREHRHRHNESGGSQCLQCGRAARRFETETPAHLFCAQRACQRDFHALQGVFYQFGVDPPVGGKRVVPQWEETRFQGWHYFPDELLCLVVLQAFDAALASTEEYDELMALRRVSARFRRVIDACVVPQIQELPEQVVAQLDLDALLHFRALRGLYLTGKGSSNSEASRLFPALTALPELRWLSVDHYHGERHGVITALPPRLTGLFLYKIHQGALTDAVLQTVRLTQLRIDRARELTDAALRDQSALRTLVLEDAPLMRDLQPCVALEILIAMQHTQVRLATVSTLTSLTQLWLEDEPVPYDDAWLGALTQLRHLGMVDNANATDAALRGLTALQSLLLTDCDAITPDALSRLTRLDTLALNGCAGVADFSLDAATPLWRSVHWLSVADTRIPPPVVAGFSLLVALDLSGMRDATDAILAGMPSLRRLVLAKTRGITGASFSRLPALDHLDLRRNKDVVDASLATLTRLRTLVLTRNKRITDNGLLPLVALNTLYLTKNKRITVHGLSWLPALALVVVPGSRLWSDKNPHITYWEAEAWRRAVDALQEAGVVFDGKKSSSWPLDATETLEAWSDFPCRLGS